MVNKLILNISHVNPKSLDIEFGAPTSGVLFKLYNADDIFIVDLSLIANSINPAFETLIINDDSNLLMLPNTNYTLKAFKDNLLVDSVKVFFTDFPAPLLPKVTPHGNRLLEIQFEYPIKNLDNNVVLSTVSLTLPVGSVDTGGERVTHSLSNFYIKYFKEDSNQSNTPNPKWPGYLLTAVSFKYGAPPNFIVLGTPFKILQSDDKRTLLIQSNVRSLPIGTHNLQIATSKIADHSLTGLHLSDFMDRDVPISEIEFEFTGAQYSAVVKSISILNPQTVEVVFTSSVVDNFGKITVNSTSEVQRSIPKESISVVRKPKTLNTLIFSMAPDTFISAGPNTITVSDVVDCHGLFVTKYQHDLNFNLPKPTIISIAQDNSIENISLTKVDIAFSHAMNKSSVIEKSNFSIYSKETNAKIDITKINFNDSNPLNLSLEFTPQLSSGIYTLVASNVMDIYSSLLDSTPYDFSIIDTTRPTVTSIIGTAEESPDLPDTILIKFSERMAVGTEHGIDKGINFKFAVDGANFKTLEDTVITPLQNNTWVRFNLKKTTPFSNINSLIRVGYIGLNNVFYLTDSSKNVIEFCTAKKFDALMPILLLDNGTASITDSNQITYILPANLNSNHLFDVVAYAEDFNFKADNSEPFKASSVTVNADLRSLVFTFSNINFSSGTAYTMSLNNPPLEIRTEDILNRPIKLNTPILITNNLRPELVSVSTVWVDNVSEPNEAILALRFSSPINVTSVNDFLVFNKDNLRLNVSKAIITDEATGKSSSEGKILELHCKTPFNANALANDLKVSTTPEPYRVTGFYSDTSSYSKLKSFENTPSAELYPIRYDVRLGSDLFSSEFDVTFTEPIDIIDPNKVPNKPIIVTGTLVASLAPSDVNPEDPVPRATIHFDNIFELRSNTSPYKDNSVTGPGAGKDDSDVGAFTPTATGTITKNNEHYLIKANLIIDGATLHITFTRDTSSSPDILNFFNNTFVLFEFLPLGYKLLGAVSGASLNETIDIRFPFKFN